MERISDDDLNSLIKKWADPVQALEEGLLELPALVELRERRAKDPRPGYLPNFQCPNCHDFMVRQEVGCLRCIKCHWTDAATGRENH